MAFEKCAKCGDDSTPWSWSSELKAHVCQDCYYRSMRYPKELPFEIPIDDNPSVIVNPKIKLPENITF